MEDEFLFVSKRKNYIELGKIYFWTATINKWQRLLEGAAYKEVILNSLTYLSNSNKIDVFAFVIMPNHIHLIWRVNELNGKETAQGSFLKYTAHEFKKMLKNENLNNLQFYAVSANNKKYEFWQRDSLAIELYNSAIAYQKLNYIHNNPIQERWSLVKDPIDYVFSSAKFYETNIKNYPFLKDLRNEF